MRLLRNYSITESRWATIYMWKITVHVIETINKEIKNGLFLIWLMHVQLTFMPNTLLFTNGTDLQGINNSRWPVELQNEKGVWLRWPNDLLCPSKAKSTYHSRSQNVMRAERFCWPQQRPARVVICGFVKTNLFALVLKRSACYKRNFLLQ